jgi:hypothetical protein
LTPFLGFYALERNILPLNMDDIEYVPTNFRKKATLPERLVTTRASLESVPKRPKLISSSDEDVEEDPLDEPNSVKSPKTRQVSQYSETSDSSDDEPEDVRAAVRSGFNPRVMETFEKDYFPEYVPYQTDYVIARNFILMLWKRNPREFLSWVNISHRITVRCSILINADIEYPMKLSIQVRN